MEAVALLPVETALQDGEKRAESARQRGVRRSILKEKTRQKSIALCNQYLEFTQHEYLAVVESMFPDS